MGIQQFKPDGTGKYSQNLFKWLTKNPRHRQVFQTTSMFGCKVFHETWRLRDITIGQIRDGSVYVSGRNLGDITAKVRGVMSMNYAYTKGIWQLKEITDEFWAAYLQKGRCVWDAEHGMYMQNDENRYSYEDGFRVCNWCGAVHEAKRETTVEVKTREFWVPYRDTTPASLLHPMGSLGEAV